jgi:hypothetical protein
VAAVGLLLAGAGCAHVPKENLPTFPRVDAAEALQVLRQRNQAVRTVSGTGLLTLTRPNGQSVRLDAAVAMQGRDHVRLRAWKLGRAVFDLTSTPDGVFLYTAEDPSIRERVRRSGLDAAELARTLQLLGGGFFDSSDLRSEERGSQFVFTRGGGGGGGGATDLSCAVDRDTLTPRRFTLRDDTQTTQLTLDLGAYVDHGNGSVYPRRFVARSADGRVTLDLRDVELNSELPPKAFVPPRRAEKLP